MRVGSDTLIDASVNLATPWTSEAVWLGHVTGFSIQLVFSGAPEGSWRLQASNDAGQSNAPTEALQSTNITNWTLIEDSSQLVAESGDHTWNVQSPGYRWVRVQWLPTAGSGSLTSARFSTKGF